MSAGGRADAAMVVHLGLLPVAVLTSVLTVVLLVSSSVLLAIVVDRHSRRVALAYAQAANRAAADVFGRRVAS